jgi:hypothetical protein
MSPSFTVAPTKPQLPSKLEVSVRNTFLHAVLLGSSTPKEEEDEEHNQGPIFKRASTMPTWPSDVECEESEEESIEESAEDVDAARSPWSDHGPCIQRLKTMDPWDAPLEPEIALVASCVDDRDSASGDSMGKQALAPGGFDETSVSAHSSLHTFDGPASWDWSCDNMRVVSFVPAMVDSSGSLPIHGGHRQAFKPNDQFQAFNSELHFQTFSMEDHCQGYSSEDHYLQAYCAAEGLFRCTAAAQLGPQVLPAGADAEALVMSGEAGCAGDFVSHLAAEPVPAAAKTAAGARVGRRQAAAGTPWTVSGQTTVMLRNLPNNYTRAMLLALIDAEGFAGSYDFLYMPIDFRTHAALGYAFVNMASPSEAERLKQCLDGFGQWSLPSSKVCSATWSQPHQGLDAHIARYRNSPLMHESVPDEYRPILFSRGERIAFPPPTKRVKPPRQGTERLLV